VAIPTTGPSVVDPFDSHARSRSPICQLTSSHARMEAIILHLPSASSHYHENTNTLIATRRSPGSGFLQGSSDFSRYPLDLIGDKHGEKRKVCRRPRSIGCAAEKLGILQPEWFLFFPATLTCLTTFAIEFW